MKNILILFSLMILATAWIIPICDSRSTGSVEQINGIYVFYRSKPCDKYEDLGTVKPGLTLTDKGSDMIDALVSKAKKNYPTGDGIVISDPDMGSASVIKFLQNE